MTDNPAAFTEVVIRATANAHDLERLCRPLLGALAEFARLDSTYLMVIDWELAGQISVDVRSSGGRIGFTAPEVRRSNELYSEGVKPAADVYALGQILLTWLEAAVVVLVVRVIGRMFLEYLRRQVG